VEQHVQPVIAPTPPGFLVIPQLHTHVQLDTILTMVFVKVAQPLTITQLNAQMQHMLLHVLQDISYLMLFAILAKE
jgi:hypothetical protein